jgi:hypothetical protein
MNNARHFIRNGLNLKNIPEKLASAVTAHVAVPALVGGKGKQGFIFWESRENDQRGKEVTTSMKLKLLGVFGKKNVRAYTTSQTSTTGEVLHTLVAIDFTAHESYSRKGHKK